MNNNVEENNHSMAAKLPRPGGGKTLSWLVYGGMALFAVLCVVSASFFSASAEVVHTTSDKGRSDLGWSTDKLPSKAKKTWEKEGFNHLIDSQGLIVASRRDSVVRLDPHSGDTLWEYRRPGATVCDIVSNDSSVVTLFDAGRGCSEITKLDEETGEYKYVASYATDQKKARLVSGDGNMVGIVTPKTFRLLRSDLVTVTTYGAGVDVTNPSEKTYDNCTIFDAALGPNDFVVSSRCEGEQKTMVRAFSNDPEDSEELELTVEVDSGVADPVSITMVSMAQMQFIIPGQSPKVYTWQLDKEKTELAARDVRQGEYATGMCDYPGIGYVWGIGETLNVRFGSEDISKSVKTEGVIGNPMTADNRIVAPTREGFLLWETKNNSKHMIKTDQNLSGRKYAFAGDTFVELVRGKLIAHKVEG